MALPHSGFTPIGLNLKDHKFTFRRLTWREEVVFARKLVKPRRIDYVAYAMANVDEKVVTYEQAILLLTNLPRPISERVVIYYLGSLPERRLVTLSSIYAAPDPVPSRQRVEIEAEEGEDAAESALIAKFGRGEVVEAEAMGDKIAAGTGLVGATPATAQVLEGSAEALMAQVTPPLTPPQGVGESPVVYHFDAT